MSKNIRRRLVCLAALAGCMTAVNAQNLNFLSKSPLAWMDKQDQAILRETIDAVLLAPDGTKTDWLNTATGNRGQVQVIDELQDFGTTCRHIRMRNEARGRVDGGVYRLCLATDGKWKFAPNAGNAPKYDATDAF
jgi:surface antigen